MQLQKKYKKAATAIEEATALLITAGAGLGVDSGLPDFRGDKGFWKAYPMYEHLGVNFIEAANPAYFIKDPAFGWGFYGHRINLYRETIPHAGFYLLQQWIDRYDLDYFVVTSNVDGQFQKAGFGEEKICEVHGSIHHLQCTKICCNDIWVNKETIDINHQTMRSQRVLRCKHCDAVARPNVLMFGDFSWLGHRTARQEKQYQHFLQQHRKNKLVIIEIGAGTSVPTIRNLNRYVSSRFRSTIIRINPREHYIAPPHISIPCGALQGLEGINKAFTKS